MTLRTLLEFDTSLNPLESLSKFRGAAVPLKEPDLPNRMLHSTTATPPLNYGTAIQNFLVKFANEQYGQFNQSAGDLWRI